MAKRERPLSPFMHYRWQYTNTLSILHRLTGLFLTFGALVLIYWLVALAAGAESYASAYDTLSSPVATLGFAGWSFSFFFHLMNGVRHLFWDAGRGYELPAARTSGWTVFIGAIVFTILFWIVLAVRMGGTA